MALPSAVRTLSMIMVINLFMTATVVGGGLILALGVIRRIIAPVVISPSRLSLVVSIRVVVISVRLPVRTATVGQVAGITVSVVAIILVSAVIPPPTTRSVRHQIHWSD